MLPWSAELSGRLDEHVITSELLRDNPLGDPNKRPLWVYVPPGYDAEPERRYPAVYVIQGYTGHIAMWRNRTAYRQPFIETADAVFARGDAPPAIVVYVDAWTAYGGSQFVDSPGTGRYHSYLCDEVVPFVDGRYRTIPDRESRAVSGKSSGGFGAMITPMLRPDLFGALATHAGDALYEYCYLPEFAQVVRHLRAYDGDIWRWWEAFHARPAFSHQEDAALITALGCSAAFSPGDDGRPVLPVDPVTGVVRPEAWERWLAWDPVRMVERYADAVLSLRAVWIDAGTADDYYLDLGAEAFRAELTRVGLPADRVHFELFEATHAAIDYRYPLALSWLAHRLAR
ncbi:MAG TPA: alpha/beta hydrolase-fold protein [Streptosporangiaceae bacterium]|nr:alpha/beta hydrolase-fold protein [Streptosporangiaceae bacterium]